MDEDGTADRAERSHEKRDFVHHQDYDGSWHHRGGCGSLRGAEIDAIFEHFVQAELLADWEQARAEHGGDVTAEKLPRTAAQRRGDAFYAMCRSAAGAHANTPGGSVITTDIVIDDATFERWARIYAGEQPDPLDLDLDLHPIEPDDEIDTEIDTDTDTATATATDRHHTTYVESESGSGTSPTTSSPATPPTGAEPAPPAGRSRSSPSPTVDRAGPLAQAGEPGRRGEVGHVDRCRPA
jgi:hypothetical protein